MFYVPGNHDPEENPRFVSNARRRRSNLDLKCERTKGLLLAGFGGSIRYLPTESINIPKPKRSNARCD